MKSIITQTERLYIRPITLDDAPALLPIFDDKEVMRFSRAGVKTLEQINTTRSYQGVFQFALYSAIDLVTLLAIF